MCPAASDSSNRIGEIAEGDGGRAVGKVNKAHFSGSENLEPSGSLELRAEQAGQRTHLSGHQLGGDAVVEGTSKAALEVIMHLALDLHVTAGVKAGAGAESDKVDVGIRRAEAEVVCEYSYRGVVVVSTSFLCQEPRRCGDEDAYDGQPDTASHSIPLPSNKLGSCPRLLQQHPTGSGREIGCSPSGIWLGFLRWR